MTFIDGAKITKRHNGSGWCANTVQTDIKSSAAARKCWVRDCHYVCVRVRVYDVRVLLLNAYRRIKLIFEVSITTQVS